MPQVTRHPRNRFMIYREDGDGNDFARVHKTLRMFVDWQDWEGSKFATKEEAEAFITELQQLKGAKVIEIIEETRFRS